jgi:aminodeoxyfutalosine synthase
MSVALKVQDATLQGVAAKVERGERLTEADALLLFKSHDLLGVGAMADVANQKKNGKRVYFSANQHINPTNVCVLRNTCTFCSFARMPNEEGSYTRSLDEVYAEAEAARENPTREFHIVGGLHPKLKLSYYIDMIRGLKERHPNVSVKALTAVEIAHLAHIEKTTSVEVLTSLKAAGLDSLPGGGAEVFSVGVRETIAQRKLIAEDWLRIHREAHQLDIPTNCTMLYGHVETMEDRVEHLAKLRSLQDETGGFLTYIPLAYHPDHNELGEQLGRTGTATTGFDDLMNIAVGRLFLDNIPHVKTHWPMVTPFISQLAMDFGCDDLEGTVVYERIYHEAGAHTPMMMSYDTIVRFIKRAGKDPVERDSLYQTLRAFPANDPIFTSEGPKAESRQPKGQDLVQLGAAPSGMPTLGPRPSAAEKSDLRVGRIGYINCYPVYGAIDRGVVHATGSLVTGTPAELNELLRVGALDVSVVSAVEYAREAAQYVLLPNLAISCDGAVRSVAVFSKRPVEQLNGATMLLSASSRTSVALLELLCKEVWRVRPHFVQARAEAGDLKELATLPHDAVLVIGDAALMLAATKAYPYRYDLGEAWKDWTGLPFVFAVWAARRSAGEGAVEAVHQSLLESRDWGLAHLDDLAAEASKKTGVALAACREYLGGLDYALTPRHLEGLTRFFQKLAKRGMVPTASFSFLSVA